MYAFSVNLIQPISNLFKLYYYIPLYPCFSRETIPSCSPKKIS
jgi:hypothetical protein